MECTARAIGGSGKTILDSLRSELEKKELREKQVARKLEDLQKDPESYKGWATGSSRYKTPKDHNDRRKKKIRQSKASRKQNRRA